MLEFRQDDTAAELILTLTEKITGASDFHFEFTQVTTRRVVTFTKTQADDESLYPNRYNQFTINPSIVFLGMPVGEWHYRVLDNNGDVLEFGKLMLRGSAEFEFQMYDQPAVYVVYNPVEQIFTPEFSSEFT